MREISASRQLLPFFAKFLEGQSASGWAYPRPICSADARYVRTSTALNAPQVVPSSLASSCDRASGWLLCVRWSCKSTWVRYLDPAVLLPLLPLIGLLLLAECTHSQLAGRAFCPAATEQRTIVHWYIGTPIHRYNGTPVHWVILSVSRSTDSCCLNAVLVIFCMSVYKESKSGMQRKLSPRPCLQPL